MITPSLIERIIVLDFSDSDFKESLKLFRFFDPVLNKATLPCQIM